MVRLHDIAKAAGVATKTASRALRGEAYVADHTRKRVLAAAQRLGYRPNLAAVSLRTQTNHEIVLAIWSVQALSELAELYIEKIAGLEEGLRGTHYPMRIRIGHADPTTEPEYPKEAIAEIVAGRPAGVVMAPFGTAMTGRCARALEAKGIPTVVLDEAAGGDGIDNIMVDRAAGVYEAVRYLVEQGRKTIAYVGSKSASARLTGYRRAIQDAGLAERCIFTHATPRAPAQYKWGFKTAERLVKQPRPDAVQATTDALAHGIIDGLLAWGVRVPEQLAVIGFDNRQNAALRKPQLTTIAHPSAEVGRAAAQVLLDKIAGKPAPKGGWSRSIPAQLVLRESA